MHEMKDKNRGGLSNPSTLFRRNKMMKAPLRTRKKEEFRGNGTMLRLVLIAAFGVSLVAGMREYTDEQLRRFVTQLHRGRRAPNRRGSRVPVLTRWQEEAAYTYLEDHPELAPPAVMAAPAPTVPQGPSQNRAPIQEEEDNKEDCTICLEPMVDRKKCVRTNCNHRYHSQCIMEWLNTANNSCPTCRNAPVRVTSLEQAKASRRNDRRYGSAETSRVPRRTRYHMLKNMRRRHFAQWARENCDGAPTQEEIESFKFPPELGIPAKLQKYYKRDSNRDDWKNLN